MSGLVTRMCGRCGATADQVRLGTLVSEPAGWTTVTVGGLPITNTQVCPGCAADVRNHLTVSPGALAASLDQVREKAWKLGYEAGCEDTANGCATGDGPALEVVR